MNEVYIIRSEYMDRIDDLINQKLYIYNMCASDVATVTFCGVSFSRKFTNEQKDSLRLLNEAIEYENVRYSEKLRGVLNE